MTLFFLHQTSFISWGGKKTMSEFIWHWTKGKTKITTHRSDIAEKALKEGNLVIGVRKKITNI